MIKTQAYTDCDFCQSSIEVSESTYAYLCNGGESEMLCDDCYGEELAVSDAGA